MDVDDDLNALLAGDGDDIDCILKDAGLTPGSDEIDLDALLADIDAEDNGSRVMSATTRDVAAAPSIFTVLSAPGEAEIAQARGKLSHALAAAAAPVGAADASSASAAAAPSKSERKPSDMDEDDMLQVRHHPTSDTASPRQPPLPCAPAHPFFSPHPHALFSRQAILDESDDDDTAPSTTTTANVVIDVSKVLAYDSGAAGSSSTAGFVRITSIRDVEADDEKTLRESCNFSMVSPLRAGFISHEQGSSTSVIQFSHLPALSAQVIGDKARSLWGLPTCLCVHAKIVACGTSLGFVVLFDHFEGFRMVLGATSQGDRVDPITCVCISPSGDWLLAAHASGRCVMWDCTRGKEEKTMNDHSAAVLHACFLDDRTVITADSVGLVLRISITHVFFTWRFSISKVFDTTPPSLGRILSMRPLESNPSAPHPSSSCEMLAMATAAMFFVVSLKPDLNMLFKEPRPPTVAANLLPYVAWRHALLREMDSETSAVEDPVLAIGWGQELLCYSVSRSTSSAHFEFRQQRRHIASGDVLNVQWVSDGLLGFITALDDFRLYDPFSDCYVASIDIKHIKLVFYVPPAAPAASPNPLTPTALQTPSFHNSVTFSDQRLFMMASDGAHRAEVLSWRGRIAALVQQGDWMSALRLGMDFYEGRAQAVAGLPRDRRSVRRLTGQRIADLLSEYVTLALSRTPHSQSSVADAIYFKELAGVCLEYCITIGRTDLLFGDIFNQFVSANQGPLFLELLEPFILNERLRVVNPVILQAFLEHFRRNRWLKRFEQCIIRLDTSTLDIDQAVKLCKKHELITALIYIYNTGLKDYTTPCEEMLSIILQSTSDVSDPTMTTTPESKRECGYKFLLYLKNCLTGRAFPRGDLPESSKSVVRVQIMKWLFAEGLRQESATVPFLHLKALVDFDCQEFLLVLADAAVVPKFMKKPRAPSIVALAPETDSISLLMDSMGVNAGPKPATKESAKADVEPSMQAICDAISMSCIDHSIEPFSSEIDIPVPASPKGPSLYSFHFSSEQQGLLLEFICSASVRGQCSLPTRIIQRTISSLVQLCIHPAPPAPAPTPAAIERRQTLTLQLLGMHSLGEEHNRTLLGYALSAKLLRVSAHLHKALQDYDPFIRCYLADTERRGKIYGVLENVLRDPRSTKADVEACKNAMLMHLKELVILDAAQAAKLVSGVCGCDVELIVKSLGADRELLFQYLRAVVISDRRSGLDEVTDRTVQLIGPQVQKLYVELLSKFAPHELVEFLQLYDGYDIQHCLKFCVDNGACDGAAFLTERCGDIAGALKLLTEGMSAYLDAIRSFYDKHLGSVELDANSSRTEKQMLARLLQLLRSAMSLCSRQHKIIDDEGMKRMWFSVLDVFLVPQRLLKEQGSRYSSPPFPIVKMAQCIFQSTSNVLFHMMSFVQFPVILSKIIQQHGTYRFDEFKQTITDMLETYHYEMAILSTANHLLSTDTFKSMRAYVRRRCKGVRVSLPSDVTAASVEALEVMPSGSVVVQPVISTNSLSSLSPPVSTPSTAPSTPNPSDRAVKRQLARYNKFYRTICDEKTGITVLKRLSHGGLDASAAFVDISATPLSCNSVPAATALVRNPGVCPPSARNIRDVGDDAMWDAVNDAAADDFQ